MLLVEISIRSPRYDYPGPNTTPDNSYGIYSDELPDELSPEQTKQLIPHSGKIIQARKRPPEEQPLKNTIEKFKRLFYDPDRSSSKYGLESRTEFGIRVLRDLNRKGKGKSKLARYIRDVLEKETLGEMTASGAVAGVSQNLFSAPVKRKKIVGVKRRKKSSR